MPGAVLLVDDERFSRTIYSDYLRAAGYDVEEADSAETALDGLRRRRFDLLVTDIVMPGANGLELLSEAKRIDPNIETLVVTSIDRVDSAVRAMKTGASDYLVKPVTPEALQAAAQSCLAGRALLARNKTLRSHLQLFEACQRISASVDEERAVALALHAVATELRADAAVFLEGDAEIGHARVGGQVGVDPETARAIADQVAVAVQPAATPVVSTTVPDDARSPVSPPVPGNTPQAPVPGNTSGNTSKPASPVSIATVPEAGPGKAAPVSRTGREIPARVSLRLAASDGSRFHLALVLPVADDDGARGYIAAIVPAEPEAQQLRSAEFVCSHLALALRALGHLAHVEHLAYLDDLTKLYNTRFLDLILDREIGAGRPFTVLFLDLDRFKSINDQHGHLVGSKLLVEVGRVLKACVRDEDVVARYGGDEYAAVLLGIDSGGALKVAERIRRSIEDHVFLSREGSRVRVTTSIGLASYPEHGTHKAEILDLADRAMYRGKRSSRNVVYIASRDLPASQTR